MAKNQWLNIRSAVVVCCLGVISFGAGGQDGSRNGLAAVCLQGPSRSVAKNPLDLDARLQVSVLIPRQTTTIAGLLKWLNARSEVKLAAEGGEVRSLPLSLRFAPTPLRDILESIAGTHNLEWEQRTKDLLVLTMPASRHLLDVFHPRNEGQAEQFRKGREFLAEVLKEPPSFQDAIVVHGNNQGGVPFNVLSTKIQTLLGEMFNGRAASARTLGQNLPFDAGNLSNCQVRMDQPNHQDGFTDYGVSVYDSKASIGMSFPVFSNPREDDRVIPASDLRSTIWYGKDEDAVTREDALANDKRLHQNVTLNLHRRTTLSEALAELLEEISFSYVVEDPPAFRRMAGTNYTIKDVPLSKAFDRLAKQFGYTWGQRRGVFLFHVAPKEQPPASPDIPLGAK